jgi:hypothetical protein
MVRVILVSVMVASVLWHTLAGCCAHHRHDESATVVLHPVQHTACGCSQTAAATSESLSHVIRDGEAPSGGQESCPGPCHGECHEAGCYFALPRSADARLSLRVFADFVLLSDVLPYRALTAPPAPTGQGGHRGRIPLGSARRHLLLGVQLI